MAGKQGCDCPQLRAMRDLQVALNSFESVESREEGTQCKRPEQPHQKMVAPGVCIRDKGLAVCCTVFFSEPACDSCPLHLVSAWRWPNPQGVCACVNQSDDTDGQAQNTFQGNNTHSKDPQLPNGTLQVKTWLSHSSPLMTQQWEQGMLVWEGEGLLLALIQPSAPYRVPTPLPTRGFCKDGCLTHLSVHSRHFIMFFE